MRRKVVANFHNVMVDLETCGRRAGCKVLSIGAVEFSADGLGREFYRVCSANGQESLHADPETLVWWDRQSKDARKVLDDHLAATETLAESLGAFTAYLAPIGLGHVKVFGNGSDFDNAILYAAYAVAGLDVPWSFWNSRCYRTLKNLVPHVPMIKSGVAHNALDDAKQQARHASTLLAMARDAGVEL